jgi:hypothetical protein
LKADWLLNCYWASLAQWFLVPRLTRLTTVFYSLTTLEAFRPFRLLDYLESECTQKDEICLNNIQTQFVPHRKHITSPLQRQTG